jgi:ABC-type bacteriocin/lantibiotic exporter with double-glycine peptidase domain
MNIVFYLLATFLQEEKWNAMLMFLMSFTINIIQTNGLSFITAKVINFIQDKDKPNVLLYFQYFILISVVYIVFFSFFKHYQNLLLTKLRQWLKYRLVNMVLTINNEEFTQQNISDLNSPISRISNICFWISDDIITFLIPNFIFLCIISIFFLYNDVLFGIGFIVSNILMIGYCLTHVNEMIKYNQIYENDIIHSEFYLIDLLNNIDKIIYRGQTDSEIKKYTTLSEKSINSAYDFYGNGNYHGIILLIMVTIIIGISISYLIYLVFQKKMSVTIFITFFTIMLLYKEKIGTLTQQIPSYIEFLGRVDSVLKYFKNTEDDYNEITNKQYNEVDLKFESIRFENVSFKYEKSEKYIYQHMNMEVDTTNDVIGITGLSGNGKSTYAKLILRMYKPSTGNIYIDEHNITELNPAYIRSNITYVNQNSKLFDKKVIENILYGCNDMDVCNSHLNEILRYPKIKQLYRNIDFENTDSGFLGENLSGGQRQVINIISGLVNPCKILIMDEPTNALDPELKAEILALIKHFKKYKQCIIIITHDKDVFPIFTKRIEM